MHDEPITVRLLGPEDAAVLENVAEGVFDNAVRPDQTAAFLASDAHLIAVALAGSQVVGMATGVIYLHPDKSPQFWINEVGTADAWRRRGIAKQTLRALMAEAVRHGCVALWLGTESDNVAARALYRSLDAGETEGLIMYDWDDKDVR